MELIKFRTRHARIHELSFYTTYFYKKEVSFSETCSLYIFWQSAPVCRRSLFPRKHFRCSFWQIHYSERLLS